VDGTQILATTDLDLADGVHPSTAGQAKYAAAVAAIFGNVTNSQGVNMENTIWPGESHQGLAFYAANYSGNFLGAPDTGDAANITCLLSIDGAAAASSNTAHPTEIGGGVYWLPLSLAETQIAKKLICIPSSTTAGVVIFPFTAAAGRLT
jgi:hypothetical protein